MRALSFSRVMKAPDSLSCFSSSIFCSLSILSIKAINIIFLKLLFIWFSFGMSSVLIGYNVKIIISRREKKLTTGFFSIGVREENWMSPSVHLGRRCSSIEWILFFPKKPLGKIGENKNSLLIRLPSATVFPHRANPKNTKKNLDLLNPGFNQTKPNLLT